MQIIYYLKSLKLGGVPRAKVSQLFHYLYSTAPKPKADFSLDDTKAAPIAGLGYGLPIARLYAKYFQGNLSLASVEGLGTWAYISIKVIPIELIFHSLSYFVLLGCCSKCQVDYRINQLN